MSNLSPSSTLPSDGEIVAAADTLSKLEPGYLPRPIFQQFTRLCVTPIIELVPLRMNNGVTEVLLLQRPTDDPDWPNALHTPGTVLRSTDAEKGIQSAFERIYNDELKTSPTAPPVFVKSVFHKVIRGTELAQVYYLELTVQDAPLGSWFNARDLPRNIVESQIHFIQDCIEYYERGGH